MVSLLASCESKEQKLKREVAEKAYNDSVVEANAQKIAKERQAMQEECYRIYSEQDSLAAFAWGDAKFGMTKSETLRTKAFKGGEILDKEYITLPYEKESAIAESFHLKSSYVSVYVNFDGQNNNELSWVRIEDKTSVKRAYDDIVYDMGVFIDEFTKKYGTPTSLMEDYKYISCGKLEKDKSILVAQWIYGVKEWETSLKYKNAIFDIPENIKRNGEKRISVYLMFDGDWYSMRIMISNTDYPKKPKVATDAEKKEVARKKQKQQEVRDYSL